MKKVVIEILLEELKLTALVELSLTIDKTAETSAIVSNYSVS